MKSYEEKSSCGKMYREFLVVRRNHWNTMNQASELHTDLKSLSDAMPFVHVTELEYVST